MSGVEMGRGEVVDDVRGGAGSMDDRDQWRIWGV